MSQHICGTVLLTRFCRSAALYKNNTVTSVADVEGEVATMMSFSSAACPGAACAHAHANKAESSAATTCFGCVIRIFLVACVLNLKPDQSPAATGLEPQFDGAGTSMNLVTEAECGGQSSNSAFSGLSAVGLSSGYDG